MVGVLLAMVFGGLQLYLLTRVVRSVAGGKVNIAAMVGQFFCPLAGLLICAFVAKRQLLVCAVGICVILVGGAVILLIRGRLQDRRANGKRG